MRPNITRDEIDMLKNDLDRLEEQNFAGIEVY